MFDIAHTLHQLAQNLGFASPGVEIPTSFEKFDFAHDTVTTAGGKVWGYIKLNLPALPISLDNTPVLCEFTFSGLGLPLTPSELAPLADAPANYEVWLHGSSPGDVLEGLFSREEAERLAAQLTAKLSQGLTTVAQLTTATRG